MSATDTLYQQLREHLHTLGLQAAADRLAPALQAAERDKPGYTQFLHDMLTHEVAALAERRLAGRLRRRAGWPDAPSAAGQLPPAAWPDGPRAPGR